MDQEVEATDRKELQVYLAASSDPTVYLNRKEVKAWNRMPKSKQKRLLEKGSRQVFKAWKGRERKGSLATKGIGGFHGRSGLFAGKTSPSQRMQKSGRTGQNGIWKPEKGRNHPEGISPVRGGEFIQTGESWQGRKPEF